MTTATGTASTERDFVLSRAFRASREVVFKAWTEREQIDKWFGPKGMTIPHCTNDLQPGGVMHYAMRAPNGNVMWGRWVYREITPPERLAFVASFSDESGGITRAPFSAGWPLEMLSTITFEEQDGGTKVTVRASAYNATELERETFNAAQDSMKHGWTGTFDQLATYLSAL